MNFAREFKEVSNLLREKKNILLACHEHPDGDAIGSMLAVSSALEEESPHKNIVLFSKDPTPDYLKFLPEIERIAHSLDDYAEAGDSPDLFLGFDYGDFQRLGIPKEAIKGAITVTFDHHPKYKQEGDILIIDETASSTCEILYEFLVAEGFFISARGAAALLTGIFTDSGGFAHVNTSMRTLNAAGDLLRRGASLGKIYRHVLGEKSPACLRAWGYALGAAEYDPQSGMTYTVVSFAKFKELGSTLEDFEGVANTLTLPPETQFSLLLIEYKPGAFKGSLRSEHFKGVDVSAIARKLGGGGHRYAAGFEQTGKTAEDVIKLVKQAARDPHAS